jgi:hypothetical protein
VLVLFCALGVNAQIMHKVYVHPAQITSNDTITIETQIAILGTCSFVDSFSIVEGNTIRLNVCYLSFETSSSVIGRDTLLFKFAPLPDGIYTVEYKVNATDDISDVICRYPDLSDSSSIAFTVGANSISNLTDELNIYPNPVVDNLAINLSQMHSAVNWQITSAAGRLLLHSVVAQPNFTIDVSTLPPGVYFIQLVNDHQQIIKRFVKH